MKVLISGGTGFIGRWLGASLLGDGHEVWALSRNPEQESAVPGFHIVTWDGRTATGWGDLVNEMDVVVNLAGKSLASWPWNKTTKQEFRDSRIDAGNAITDAIFAAAQRPKVLIQSSGINHYGLRGDLADETTPPEDDFLAQLTIAWEDATAPVEELGVRRVIIRSAVVLAKDDGMLPQMALPIRLFVGGRLGTGKQAMPWIHIADEIGAIRFLIDHESASGPFNLSAPQPTSSNQFMRALARALKRPYWFPTPAFLVRSVLGEMSVLVLQGRYSRPSRLLDLGYNFQFPALEPALAEIFAQ
jgi:uncharacterized protein (TIGR01777 family)